MFLASPSASPKLIFSISVIFILLPLLFVAALPSSYIPSFCFLIKLLYFALFLYFYLSFAAGRYSAKLYCGWPGYESNVWSDPRLLLVILNSSSSSDRTLLSSNSSFLSNFRFTIRLNSFWRYLKSTSCQPPLTLLQQSQFTSKLSVFPVTFALFYPYLSLEPLPPQFIPHPARSPLLPSKLAELLCSLEAWIVLTSFYHPRIILSLPVSKTLGWR